MAKLKHWQGYGCLDAKKLADYPYGYRRRKAVIQVEGNHEYGIILHEPYDVWNWLCKRFVKDCLKWTNISDLKVTQVYSVKDDEGRDVEAAVYEIEYTVSQ